MMRVVGWVRWVVFWAPVVIDVLWWVTVLGALVWFTWATIVQAPK